MPPRFAVNIICVQSDGMLSVSKLSSATSCLDVSPVANDTSSPSTGDGMAVLYLTKDIYALLPLSAFTVTLE